METVRPGQNVGHKMYESFLSTTYIRKYFWLCQISIELGSTCSLNPNLRLHVDVCVILTKIKMCQHILKLTEVKLHENLSVRPDGRDVGQGYERAKGNLHFFFRGLCRIIVILTINGDHFPEQRKLAGLCDGDALCVL